MILLIVDPQYDFIEGGKLPVNGGKKALDKVVSLINTSSSDIDKIIITKDWHKPDHPSFKGFGGQFPEHCVANSFGARVYEPIKEAIRKNNIYTEYFHKGFCKEAFSAFIRKYHVYNNAISYETQDALQDDKSELTVLPKNNLIVVCGIAGDICVSNTLKVLKDLNISVFEDGIASLDGGKKISEFCEKLNTFYLLENGNNS